MLRPAVVASMLGLVAACGGSPVPELPPGTPVSYGEHLEELVLLRCLSCHTTEEPKAELILEAGSGYDQMVGRRSVQSPELLLVAPGDPEASYLWLKVDHRASEGKGMPRTLFGAKRLPEAEVEIFRRWIEDGALP
jgi:hypothetical protein